jgi:hypothetical protein
MKRDLTLPQLPKTDSSGNINQQELVQFLSAIQRILDEKQREDYQADGEKGSSIETIKSDIDTINTNFPDNVKAELNASGDAPIYACRAWVNFNGTGTVAIRASGNVSSITDEGTGNWKINFSTSMEDANYVITAMAQDDGSGNGNGVHLSVRGDSAYTPHKDYARIGLYSWGGSWYDSPALFVAIFR